MANDNKYRRSFYGHRVVVSPDARFALVADTAGSSMTNPQGQVSLYWRRTSTENLFPTRFASVSLPQISTSDTSPYRFEKLAVFVIQNTTNSSSIDSLPAQADHLGLAMAMSKDVIVISSPLKQCVYTFVRPQTISDPALRPITPPKTNYTIMPPMPSGTPGNSNNDSGGFPSWLIALITSLISVLIITPIAWKTIQRRHKQRVLKNLADNKATYAGEMSAIGSSAMDSNDMMNATSNDQLTGKKL